MKLNHLIIIGALCGALLIPSSASSWGVVGLSAGAGGGGAVCSGTIGNTLETDTDGDGGNLRIVVQQITATCTDSEWTMYNRISYTDQSGRGYTLVLYSDNGSNVPNECLEYHTYTSDGTASTHWISQAFTTEIANGTKYWIGAITQSATSVQYYSASTGGVSYRGYVSDYTSPPAWSSVTSPTSQVHNLEKYIEY